MSEIVSPSTGEITVGIPPAIATAIIAVKKRIRQLGADERNEHARYNYVSVDKFYGVVGPLMADAGLALLINEVDTEVRASESEKKTPWLFARYELTLIHESGVASAPMQRSLAMPINGPQTYGSAQSYVEKQFLRQVFKIPTGEKDADETAQSDDAPARWRAAPRIVSGARRPAADLDAFAAEARPAPDYDGQGRLVAATGTEPLRHWWKSLPPAIQRQLQAALPEYKAIAEAADKALAAAEPFDLTPDGRRYTAAAERDAAFWAGAVLGLGPASDGRQFRAMMHQRLREARTAREVEALRTDNPQIDELPRADREEVLGAMMDRELELRAAGAAQ